MSSPFISFREEVNDEQHYFILQKKHPHYIGKIATYPIENSFANAPIGGYNLWVTFDSTLEGRYVPSYKDVIADINVEIIKMADWYTVERVNKNPRKYAKFKIK